jgi:hypothetical protein
VRTRCGLGGEAPEHAASENNHPQIRLSCMAVLDAAVHRTRMIGATPFQAPPGPRSRPHGLNASVWGRGKLAPIIQVAQFTLVRSKVLPFLDCKDARSAGKGKGMEMIHPGHEYAVQAESYPPPGSSYMDRKRTYQK